MMNSKYVVLLLVFILLNMGIVLAEDIAEDIHVTVVPEPDTIYRNEPLLFNIYLEPGKTVESAYLVFQQSSNFDYVASLKTSTFFASNLAYNAMSPAGYLVQGKLNGFSQAVTESNKYVGSVKAMPTADGTLTFNLDLIESYVKKSVGVTDTEDVYYTVIYSIPEMTVLPPDADRDGLPDTQETTLGTDPNVADTDGDGLNDGEEVYTAFTDPLDVDSDDDTFSDSAEVAANTNPNDANSRPFVDVDGDGIHDLDESSSCVHAAGLYPLGSIFFTSGAFNGCRKGDMNNDGYVTVADYSPWLTHYGTGEVSSRGDMNLDSFVTVADYSPWLTEYYCGNHWLDLGENCVSCPADVTCPIGTICNTAQKQCVVG